MFTTATRKSRVKTTSHIQSDLSTSVPGPKVTETPNTTTTAAMTGASFVSETRRKLVSNLVLLALVTKSQALKKKKRKKQKEEEEVEEREKGEEQEKEEDK